MMAMSGLPPDAGRTSWQLSKTLRNATPTTFLDTDHALKRVVCKAVD